LNAQENCTSYYIKKREKKGDPNRSRDQDTTAISWRPKTEIQKTIYKKTIKLPHPAILKRNKEIGDPFGPSQLPQTMLIFSLSKSKGNIFLLQKGEARTATQILYIHLKKIKGLYK
jgi:hypothetical protein